jgi:uncharacterized protein (TIGR00645 family)
MGFLGGTMRPIERGFETALFMSRWLLAPFLVGLVLTVLMLLFRFFADFVDLTIRLPALSWHELIVGILNMVDIVLRGLLRLREFPAQGRSARS